MALHFHLLASLLALTGLSLTGCRPAQSAFTPTFECEVSLSAPPSAGTPDETTVANEIGERARELGEKILVDFGDASDGRLTIQISSATEPEAQALMKKLTNAGVLELRTVHPNSSKQLYDDVMAGNDIVPGYVPYENHRTDDTGAPLPSEYLLLGRRSQFQGKHIRRAFPDPDRSGVIVVDLTSAGARRMTRITGSMAHGRDRLAIVLNDEIKSAPVVQATLGSSFIIEGIDDAEREALCAALLSPYSTNLKIESLKPLAPAAPKP